MTVPEILQRAVQLHQQGRLADARSLYLQVLAHDPRQFDALHLLGVIEAVSGRPREAIALIGQAIAQRPDDPIAHDNLGLAQSDAGEPLAALASFERATALHPGRAEPHYHRGNLLRLLRRWDEALTSLERALALHPGHAAAWCDRGTVLCALRRWDDALASFDRAVSLQPGLLVAWSNRAVPLRELGRLEEGVASCERALAGDPDQVEALCNRGSLLHSLHRVDEAIASYDRALALQPDNPSAHVNRGLARLLAGDFAGGWSDYEWRWRDNAGWVIQEARTFVQPRWRGDTPLAGRRILLHSEQGYGDTIQFCRFAAQLAERGAHVIIEVPAALATLMPSVPGVAEVVVHGEELPSFDCYCPLLSLPLALGIRLDGIPAAVPYVGCGAARQQRWAARLGAVTRLRVGLAWAGAYRVARPELWSTNERRNLPPARLAVLHDIDAEFYSLQRDAQGQAAVTALSAGQSRGPAIRDFTAEIEDFADAAALIGALDLVITVDTATAHLAGALGKPVWILNRHDNCWRWLVDRDDSPWYPTARLYRQPRPGDWDDVLQRVHADLRQLADAAAARSAQTRSS